MSGEKHPASNLVAVLVLGLEVSTERQDGLSEDKEWSAALIWMEVTKAIDTRETFQQCN